MKTPAAASSERGAVLLAALGLLALFSLFVAAFTSVLRLESRASENTQDSEMARLAADAGIEWAILRLTQIELADPITSPHAPWRFRDQTGLGFGIDLPLDVAECLSLSEGALLGRRKPSPAALPGASPREHLFYYSGLISQSGVTKVIFALKIQDAASKLSLNGEQSRDQYARMLDALGRFIVEAHRGRERVRNDRGDERAPLLNPIEACGGGRAIFDERERVHGFTSVDQLAALGAGPDDLALLRDYLTVDAWLDPAMVRFEKADPGDPNEDATVTRQRRAPVNLNTASWPVLAACLEGLSLPAPTHGAAGPTAFISRSTARQIAEEIVNWREGDDEQPEGRPFRSWNDFSRFLAGKDGTPNDDGLGGEHGLFTLTPLEQAIILANANPNSVNPGRNPSRVISSEVTKRELDPESMTTEFSLISYGRYEITSLGRVVNDALTQAEVDQRLRPGNTPLDITDGYAQELARCQVSAAVTIYDTYRLLTQADFEACRDSTGVENTCTFPYPVRALTAVVRNYELDYEAEEERLAPDIIREARVQNSSKITGYAQLIAAEPQVPAVAEHLAQSGSEHFMHYVRFGRNLEGRIYEFELSGGGLTTHPSTATDWPFGPIFQRVMAYGLTALERSGMERDEAVEALDLAMFVGDLSTAPSDADQSQWERLIRDALADVGQRFGYEEYDALLAPDGLIVRAGREKGADLRFRTYTHDSLDRLEPPVWRQDADHQSWCLVDQGALALWFQLAPPDWDEPPGQESSRNWTPLLDAWAERVGTPGVLTVPDADETHGFQVEARWVGPRESPRLQLRARRWSMDKHEQAVSPHIWEPDYPPEGHEHEVDDDSECPHWDKDRADQDADLGLRGERFNHAMYAMQVELPAGEARPGEWHHLYVPFFANVLSIVVDGRTPEDPLVETNPDGVDTISLGGASWKRPRWPKHPDKYLSCWGRLAPGGFLPEDDAWEGGPPAETHARPQDFATVTIDELVTTNTQPDLLPVSQNGQGAQATIQRLVEGRPGQVFAARYTPLQDTELVGTFFGTVPAFSESVKLGRILWTVLFPDAWGDNPYPSPDRHAEAVYRYSSVAGDAPVGDGADPGGDASPRSFLISEEDEHAQRARLADHYERLLTLQPRQARGHFQALADALRTAPVNLLGLDPAAPDAEAMHWPDFLAGGARGLNAGTMDFRIRFANRTESGDAVPEDSSLLNISPILDDVILPYQERVRMTRYELR